VTGNIAAVSELVNRPPTIRDVAARAGVSHQTVSRVINDNPQVTAATRERVLTSIKELGFVPNPLARGLLSNQTRSLGVVAEDISDQFFARMAAGAEAEARRRGYYLMIGSVEPGDNEAGYLRLMLERRVEGLIVARPSVPLSAEALSAGIPVVAVGIGAHADVTVVDVDNRQGGCDATKHLLDRGHRRIATIVGPAPWPSAASRLDGYRDALQRAGAQELVEHADGWGLDEGFAAASRLLERDAGFTALFAHSDLIALGAIRRLREGGLRIPDDVSVVGYDDLPVAAYVEPALTTVHQPMHEVGVVAAGLLLDQLAGGAPLPVAAHLLPARLVVRQSVR
jgi:LacI family transcriptional regulator